MNKIAEIYLYDQARKMNIIVSGIYIALIVIFAFRKDYTNLIVLMVLSLLGNMFYFDFYGSRIQAYQLIPLS